MTICERIFAELDKQNKMAADMCRVLGVGTSQTTSWKNRNTDPPAKYMVQIADFLDVSLEYLLTGVDSSSSKLSPLETDLLAMFRDLPTEQKHEFVGELKGYLKATQPVAQDRVG